MIVKKMESKNLTSPNTIAGGKHEKNVAFYLRRAFKDAPQTFVFNDFKFTHNNETAQIDHLILYRFGFVLVESKSITGNVSVNNQEEWSRSYRDKWQGMSSPIKQVQLQAKLLKDLLHENRSKLVGKFLGLQQTLGKRSWDHICTVSSNAIVERDNMPNDISKKLVKSEFLVDILVKIMDLKSDVVRTLNVLDNRPAFNDKQLIAIRDFLSHRCLGEIKPENKEIHNIAVAPILNSATIKPINDVFHPPKVESVVEKKTRTLVCKNCNENKLLTPLSGRYGYFVKCGVCEVNTPLKMPCRICNSKKTKVSKRKELYTLKCLDCEQEELLLTHA